MLLQTHTCKNLTSSCTALSFQTFFFQILDVDLIPQAFHKHVVYVHFHGLSNDVNEHFVYQPLVSNSCILEPKRHHPLTVQSLLCGEGGLLLVLWVHPYLIINVMRIHVA